MAGNQAIFDRALEQYQLASRAGDWNKALTEAARAMTEFPTHEQARIAVATALFHTNKLPQSLQLWQELLKRNPDNPIFTEYIAKIYRAQGDTDQAIDLFMQLAERLIDQKLPLKAVRAYRDILDIHPSHEEARVRLAMVLAESGDKPGAIREYLNLGQQFYDAEQYDAADEAAVEALNVDPASLSAQEFKKKVDLARQALITAATGDQLPDQGRLQTKEQIERAVNEAIEYQNNGLLEQAAQMYERVVEVLPERADMQYSLGLIYDELERHQDALRVLDIASHNDEYALSAHFAIGTIYQKIGQMERAAQEFEQAIRYVDLQSIGKEEATDLIDMYEATSAIYLELGDVARAASLYSTLAGFLQGKRWGTEQAAQYNTKAKELTDRSMMSKLRMLGTGILNAPPPEEAVPEPQTETWGKMPSITDFLSPKSRVEANPMDDMASLEALINSNTNHLAQSPQTLLTDIDPLDVLAANLPPVSEVHFAPLTPIDTEGRSERIQRLVEASESFTEQNFLYAALDACHEIIRYDLEFYAIHLRMAEILERFGRMDQALSKLNLLIETYKARGETHKAIGVYHKLIDLSADSTIIRAELAEVLRKQGRNDEAAEQLAYVANQQFRQGQTVKALEQFRKLLEWAPDSVNLRAQYGQVLLKLERWEAALEEFRRVIVQKPDDLVVMAQANIALAMMGEFPDAIWDSVASLMQKLASHPQQLNDVQAEYRSVTLITDRAIIQFLLGLIQQSTKQHQSAMHSFNQALELLEIDADPLVPPVLVYQAIADSYIAEGNAAGSIEQLRKIEAILITGTVPALSTKHAFAQPFNEGELQRRLAEAYAANENFEGAIQALQRVKQLLPYDRQAYTKLADIYFRQGRLPEALTQLDELASYYESQSQLDRALEILATGLQLAPKNIPIKSRHAQMLMRRGYLDEGLVGLNELAELQRKQGLVKDAVASIQQVADVYWTLGKVDKAAEMYNRIVQIAPNDTEARQHLVSFNILSLRTKDAVVQLREIARLSIQQRNYEEAIASFHQVIALDQKDADAYEQLADVLMRVQEYGQAVRTYKQLAKLLPDDERVEALQSAAQRMLDQQQVAKG
ncbi:tetratricopeptide repeat protein [Herpetosiphon llansteffanensis]|uniref:tetratricopeptide repeat protein n=1 Tax=Herpetosiphon llansteffanensis TaxID=2094568 RepID=UPI000D7CB8A4|nr:tetratricopeptide repeat protein [Herpetosiphon llansteffanensis]